MTEDAFPSLGYVCQKLGLHVRYIGRSEATTDPGVWAEHLTDVDLVLITHVHSNTGQLIPAAEITGLARDRGITSIVDVAQSVGVIPIDLGAWDADVVVGSCVKWLCGGPGAGWLWAHPDLIDRCEPVDVGWFSHEDPFEFDIHQFRYASDALRFWGGTPAVVAPAIAARSIELIDEIGVDQIRRHNLEMTDRLVEGLGALLVSPLAHHRRSGTIIVDPASATEAVGRALRDAGIAVDHRPSGFRLSPHIYTSSADIDATIACVRSAAS
jgi:selenocysteine lyase/cysteine desulfurase